KELSHPGDRLHRRASPLGPCRGEAGGLAAPAGLRRRAAPSRSRPGCARRIGGPAASGMRPRMIGMVLVTHGRLAAEFVAALEHIVGPQAQIEAVCIGADDDMEKRRQDILRSIAAVDTGDGAVLLTDMFG